MAEIASLTVRVPRARLVAAKVMIRLSATMPMRWREAMFSGLLASASWLEG